MLAWWGSANGEVCISSSAPDDPTVSSFLHDECPVGRCVECADIWQSIPQTRLRFEKELMGIRPDKSEDEWEDDFDEDDDDAGKQDSGGGSGGGGSARKEKEKTRDKGEGGRKRKT